MTAPEQKFFASFFQKRRPFFLVLLAAAAIVIALPLALLACLNLAPVQRLIERETPALTGGMVHLAGLHGRFPSAPRLDHLTLTDANGAWLTADAICLDWSPAALATFTARIDAATIGHLTILRQPLAAKPTTPARPAAPFHLPVTIDVASLTIARADIATAVAGVPFAASLHATALIRSLQNGRADLTVTRLDAAGAYHVDGVLTPSAVTGHLSLHEPARGLLAALGKLQSPGPIDITASLDGRQSAERAHLDATAGPLRATLDGTADLAAQTMALDADATAPAMRLRPDLAWQAIGLHAHIAGPFTKPDGTGRLTLTNVTAAAAALPSLHADLTANNGSATLHAILTGLRIPGRNPTLFAAAPIDLQAGIDLAAPQRPAHLHLTHPLVTADAIARIAGPISALAKISLPDLAPLFAAAGADLRGHADLNATLTTDAATRAITTTGIVTIDGGATLPSALRGDTKLDMAALLSGQDLALHHASITNKNVQIDASGTASPNALNLTLHTAAPNLAAFSSEALGGVSATGTLTGTPQHANLSVSITGEAGSPRSGKRPVTIDLTANNLPSAPRADLHAKIFVAGADAVLAATAATDASGAIRAVLTRADWKSFAARADITTPKGGVPAGKLTLTDSNLADFAAVTGQPLSGSLRATLTATAEAATARLDGTNLAVGPRRIASLILTGRATGLQSDPDLNGTLTLAGISAEDISGGAKITAQGRPAALQLHAAADLEKLQGAPATLSTSALLNARTREATLQTLVADWKSLPLRLQAPAHLVFAERIAIDRLRLAVGTATATVAGQFAPTLNFTAALRGVTPDLAKPFAPMLNAAGTLAADATLTGAPAAATGTIRLTATGLRARGGPAASLPPATITARADLGSGAARLDAHIDAGAKLHLAATGTAPLTAAGTLAIRTTGALDLSLLNPILQAAGRNATGRATLDLTATGTQAAPRLAGTVTLANADIQDYVQGLHLSAINGTIDADGDTLTPRISATAGPGTLAIRGTIGLSQPGLPIDMRITARNARPLASDLLTATFDTDILVHGQATATLDATGDIKLRRVDINIPDSLPPSVARLNVRVAGAKSPPAPTGPAAPPSIVRLALEVDSDNSIFIRGKGLNANLGGTLHVHGTSTMPMVTGGFTLRRGDFSLAGTTLTFSKGDVSFNGLGMNGQIDPTLDFEADSYSGNITATLKITGTATVPKIGLSSVPDLPQDEILARLLFGQSMSQLSGFQIAEIGAALADISGITGGGEGPLGSLRRGLGLDRLTVGGGGTNGSTPTVEAGRYVAKGVYVGTKQAAGGSGGTQVEVQIDLTRHLKLNTALGSGGTAQGATPDNDPGSSVGLSYGFEY
jgi:translocation and assembly module TamB